MNTEVCLFCLEIVENESNFTFHCNCNLIFHDSCIQKWMEFTNVPQCPLCRRIVDDIEYIEDLEPVTHDDYIPDSCYYYDIQFCYIFLIIITLFTFVIFITYYIISHY